MNFCAIRIIRLDSLDVRHRTRSFFIWLNPRREIYFTKGTDSHVCKGMFATYKDTRFGGTPWNEEIGLCL